VTSNRPSLFTSSNQTITAAGELTIAHGLSTTPANLIAYLFCSSGNSGYDPGDIVYINMHIQGAGTTARGAAVRADATNIIIRFGSDSNTFSVLRKDTGAVANINNSLWRYVIRAFV